MAKRLVKLESLEFVSKIVCKFPAFDNTSVGTREFLRRLGAAKLKNTNPKCEIKHEVLRDGSPAAIEFAFDDGTKHTLLTSGLTLNQITQRVNQKRVQIRLVEMYKLNPGDAEPLKALREHFKNVEAVLGFDKVLFEIPTGQGLTSVPIEQATAEEIKELNLEQHFREEV
jgi:hypothetical protein